MGGLGFGSLLPAASECPRHNLIWSGSSVKLICSQLAVSLETLLHMPGAPIPFQAPRFRVPADECGLKHLQLNQKKTGVAT